MEHFIFKKSDHFQFQENEISSIGLNRLTILNSVKWDITVSEYMALTAVSQKSALIFKYILVAFQNKITDFEKIYVNINRKKPSNIISNDRSFECPIIYTYTIHNVYLLIDTYNNA